MIIFSCCLGDDAVSDGIKYQNKDVLFKVLSQNYESKSFEALGLKLPKIKKVLPTNLPTKHKGTVLLCEFPNTPQMSATDDKISLMTIPRRLQK